MPEKKQTVYFDNAATSWPKPPGTVKAISNFIENIGANPGRSGHRLSVEASRVVYAARENIAVLFHVDDPMRVVFGSNITEALNLALWGLLRPGDHIITSSMEHNSMMRPLHALQEQGVQVTVIQCAPEGLLDPEDIEAAIRPATKMIALNHASNVCGTLLPVADVGAIARKHNLLFLVDTAQTGGAYPIDMQDLKIDLLGFTGHKSLYGPMGTGGLVIGERVDVSQMNPLKQGGTGSHSEHEIQPDFLPDKFESGTPNAAGLAGLNAGIDWVLKEGVNTIRSYEENLTQTLVEGLQNIPGVTVYGTGDASRQTSTVSFNLTGMAPSAVSLRLDEDYQIMCRVGLHCSPAAHKTLGTYPAGTIRFGLGAFNTLPEVYSALGAVSELAKEIK